MWSAFRTGPAVPPLYSAGVRASNAVGIPASVEVFTWPRLVVMLLRSACAEATSLPAFSSVVIRSWSFPATVVSRPTAAASLSAEMTSAVIGTMSR